MSSLSYIAESVPWALGGLLLGHFIGRATVAADALADVAETERGDTMSDAPDPPPRRRLWLSTNTVIVGVIVALGLLTAIQAYVQGEATDRQAAETQRLTEVNRRLGSCLEDFANGVADALDARFAASSAAQQALDDLLDTVSSATPDAQGRARAQRALDDYQRKRTDAKNAQRANPYPPAPRDVCRDVH